MLVADVAVVGEFATVADVKAAVDGVVAPIVVLFIVVLFIGPTIFPVAASTNKVVSLAYTDPVRSPVIPPNAVIVPPKFDCSPTPNPPATVNAPVFVALLSLVLLTATVVNDPIASPTLIVPVIDPDKFLYVILSGAVELIAKTNLPEFLPNAVYPIPPSECVSPVWY